MGFVGASLRYILEVLFPAGGGFPGATLVINLFGCFVLEIINAYVGRRMHLPKPLVKSMGIGLVGAFTTVAAFSTECLAFLQQGAYSLAFTYISVTLFGTFLASLLGSVCVAVLEKRRMHKLLERREELHELYLEHHSVAQIKGSGTGVAANVEIDKEASVSADADIVAGVAVDVDQPDRDRQGGSR